MLWLRYGPGRGNALMSLDSIYFEYCESPGTKAFTCRKAARLFVGAAGVTTHVQTTHGDLLESGAGQRHAGRLLSLARRLWPRWLLRRVAKRFGLFLMIADTKPIQ
jgi:hypothetical protein